MQRYMMNLVDSLLMVRRLIIKMTTFVFGVTEAVDACDRIGHIFLYNMGNAEYSD